MSTRCSELTLKTTVCSVSSARLLQPTAVPLHLTGILFSNGTRKQQHAGLCAALRAQPCQPSGLCVCFCFLVLNVFAFHV